MIRHAWFAASLLLLGCKEAPTTVLLEIGAAPGVALDELRLTIFEPGGEAVRERRLPAQGTATVPASVVLYPRAEGVLRLLVRARLAGAPVGEGATTVAAVRATQVRTALLIRGGTLPDGDGDGVPDLIDGCPTIPNPTRPSRARSRSSRAAASAARPPSRSPAEATPRRASRPPPERELAPPRQGRGGPRDHDRHRRGSAWRASRHRCRRALR